MLGVKLPSGAGDDVLELTSVPSYTGDVYLTLVPLSSRDEEVLKVTSVPINFQ